MEYVKTKLEQLQIHLTGLNDDSETTDPPSSVIVENAHIVSPTPRTCKLENASKTLDPLFTRGLNDGKDHYEYSTLLDFQYKPQFS